MPIKMIEFGAVQIEECVLHAAGYFKKVPNLTRFLPVIGEPYWYLNYRGDAETEDWAEDRSDTTRYELNNCFRTKEEAEADYPYRVCLTRVQDKLDELTVEPLDWTNRDQPKYSPGWDCSNHKPFSVRQTYWKVAGALYGSVEASSWVTENMVDELKLLAGVS